MKKIWNILLITILCFFITGCGKLDLDMSIKKDKSMIFSVLFTVNKEYISSEDKLFTDEDIESFEQNGFKAERYINGNNEGFILKKEIDNIDNVSKEEDVIYYLSKALDTNDNNNDMFKIDRGFIRDTYTAVMKFNASDSGIIVNDKELSTYEDQIDNVDINFKVSLPYGVISSNATNNDVVWNLKTSGEQTIEFKFAVYNMSIIFIILGVILLIICLFIFLKRNNKKKKVAVNNDENQIEIKQDFNDDIAPEPILKRKATIMEENK